MFRTAVIALSVVVAAQQVAVASPASALLKALGRYVPGKALKEGGELLGREVGEEVVDRVATRVVREGGEESLEQVTKLVAVHGPEVVRAIDNAPDAMPVLKALNGLPAEDVAAAATRLAAGKTGRELAEITVQRGTAALSAEVAHPGVGARIVRVWGDDGADLAGRLSRDEAITLGQHVDDLATVTPTQRKQLLAVIKEHHDRFFQWLGGFIADNPGSSIGSATFLAVFLPNAERILGGDEVVIGPDGEPRVVRKSGLLGAPTEKVAEATSEGIGWITKAIAVAAFVSILGIALVRMRGAWIRDSHLAARNPQPQSADLNERNAHK